MRVQTLGRLGDTDAGADSAPIMTDDSIDSSLELRAPGPSFAQQIGMAGAASAGGALTGFLASRTPKGALIGAFTNLALFGLATGLTDTLGSTTKRATYVGFGVLSAGLTAYLFLQRGR